MEAIIELNENESMEFASLIQAKLDLTRNRLETLDVILRSLSEAGIHIIIPSRAPKNKVTQKFKENKDKLAVVLNNNQVSEINTLMDRGLPLTRSINEVIELFVECFTITGYTFIIPGITDVDLDEKEKDK